MPVRIIFNWLFLFNLCILLPLNAWAKVVINGTTYTVTYLIGDSLTDGMSTYGKEHLAGYRGVLYEELKSIENPLFVGTSRTNSLPLLPLPAAAYSYHDGHPGFRLDQLYAFLPFWSNDLLTLNETKINAADVDRVLVMGGTNDILQGATAATTFGRFFALIYGTGPNNEFPGNPPGLLATFPNAKIYVATIPPLYLSSLVRLGQPEIAQAYNASLKEQISQIKVQNPALGERLKLVDQYTTFETTQAIYPYIPNPYVPGAVLQVGDGIHPNDIMADVGYATMAATWFNAIKGVN